MNEQANVAKEIINMKKEYSASNTKGYHKSEAGMNLANSAQALRQQAGLDESRYGAHVSLADALTNYAEDFGGARGQSQQPSNQQGGFNQEESFNQYQDMMQGSSDAMFQQQQAQFDKILAGQIADLEKSYADAIAQGEISVRDAEAQFAKQKQEIEQSAYQQAEATKAYGNNMGIGHSQQMIGLQQGDNARVNSVHNANMSDRDKRINDIRDRINAISAQKDLDIGRAKAEYGYNVAGARAQADQNYMQQIGTFMNQNHFTQMGMQHDSNMADKQQGFAKEMEGIRQNNDIAKMAIQQGYNLDNMSQAQVYKLEEMAEANKYTVSNMKLGHGFDLEKIEAQILGQLRTIDRQAGHQASENAKARASQAKQARDYLAEEQAKYERQLERDLRGITPGTKEYQVIVGRNNLQQEQGLKQVVNEVYTQSVIDSVFNNPAFGLDTSMPKDYQSKSPLGKYDPVGGALNVLTGRKKAVNDALVNSDSKLDAIKKKKDFLANPSKFIK